MQMLSLFAPRVVVSALMLFLLVPLASAQDTEDRAEREDRKVIIEIEDGERRVTVDGEVLSDEEAEEFLKTWRAEGRHGRFRLGPDFDVTFSGKAPHIARFRERSGEPGAFILDGFDFEGFNGWHEDLEGHLPDRFFLRDSEAPMVMGLRRHGSMKEHAEIARMDAESRRLARQVREAEGAERVRLEAELREKLAEIFERKQTLRAEHIETMREQLRELEAEQSERAAARAEIIERRLKTLLGERDKYDW